MPHKTPVLDALSILHGWAENQADNLDQALYQADDGEDQTVTAAKEEFQVRAANMIRDLQHLIRQSQKLPWTKFRAAHL